MLKSASKIVEADPRHAAEVIFYPATGLLRPAEAADLHALVAGIEVSAAAPPVIRQQFDLARNAFVYSWFVYELATLAEKQAYAVVEMALREKVRLATGKSPGRRDLRSLIQDAERRGWLRRADFGEGVRPFHPLDAIVALRNDLAHGSGRLMPNGSLDMIELCAEVINRLFLFPPAAEPHPAPEALATEPGGCAPPKGGNSVE
ncbi:MAG: hypothetical protein M0002_20535 [Rhodospirillales bacterium]|nr:hypothetical protein [Rhodospirillales bacterium]